MKVSLLTMHVTHYTALNGIHPGRNVIRVGVSTQKPGDHVPCVIRCTDIANVEL